MDGDRPTRAPDVVIRAARPDEGERLREIAIASKAHWGFALEQVRAWAAAGDFSAGGLRAKEVCVAETGGAAIGWAALIPRGEAAWLDDLWVEPPWIGQGVGSRLFVQAAARARELGAKRLEWEAEPNAVGFSEACGGR